MRHHKVDIHRRHTHNQYVAGLLGGNGITNREGDRFDEGEHRNSHSPDEKRQPISPVESARFCAAARFCSKRYYKKSVIVYDISVKATDVKQKKLRAIKVSKSSGGPLTLVAFHQPDSARCSIPSQETNNTLVIPLKLRMSIDDGDYLDLLTARLLTSGGLREESVPAVGDRVSITSEAPDPSSHISEGYCASEGLPIFLAIVNTPINVAELSLTIDARIVYRARDFRARQPG
ncbi:hypothetical protein EVAR_73775_1 [Eumeta japonica]|uniref:Uncharacterized protein n=1 Tax=Eumeta variegata TaxID=151549 RepID=A0A4C1ZZS7_EUMVA|nr:hypothetical protein EVAR_73775_1 [Eumeta japonica]